MNWFGRLCRDTGLMLHHAAAPLKHAAAPRKKAAQVGKTAGETAGASQASESAPSGRERREVNRQVQESRPGPGVTLRRTTIDEIEIDTTELHDTADRPHEARDAQDDRN